MRYSAVLAAAYAAGALAGPIVLKRAYVTELTVVTVTEYVTAGAPEPTGITEQDQQDESYEELPKDEPEAPVITPEPIPEQPAEEAPVEDAPVEEAPVEEAPVEEVPVEEAPVEEAPVEDTRTETEQPADPVPEPPAESPAPEQPSSSDPGYGGVHPVLFTADYQETILHHHNVHRANHSAADLVWSQELAVEANNWGQSCNFSHHNPGYGQNLAASAPDSNVTAQITEGWYNGEFNAFGSNFGSASPDKSNFMQWGHLTQMLWKDTKEVGCATVDCRNTEVEDGKDIIHMWYTVCNYLPTGNFNNDYVNQVGVPLNHPTVHWENKL